MATFLQAAKKSAKKAKKEAMKTPEKSAEEPTPSKEKVSLHMWLICTPTLSLVVTKLLTCSNIYFPQSSKKSSKKEKKSEKKKKKSKE